jgi:ADP-ribose pyrophosphatase
MTRIGKKTLWEGKFLRTLLITYRDGKGVERLWEAVGRVHHEQVVSVVPVTRDGRLLLIRQYRPALDRFVLEFPAGLVDRGEKPLEAAGRELVEETLHAADRLEVLTTGVVSSGINTEEWLVILATGVHPADGTVLDRHAPDENEEIEVVPISWDGFHREVEELRQGGAAVDVRIYGFYELARLRLGAGGPAGGATPAA